MKLRGFVITVQNCNEFKNVVKYFQAAQIDVAYKEVGFGICGGDRGYHAVFYSVGMEDNPDVQCLIQMYKAGLS